MFYLKRMILLVTLLFAGNVCSSELPLSGQSPAARNSLAEPVSSSAMAEVAGRVLTLFTHPKLPQKLWAGTAHGGLWHSGDNGNTWRPVSGLMGNLTVSSLAADPGTPDIMYAGTGEGRSNDVAFRGAGMFKSEDGGASWTLLPLTSPAKVGENWSHINHIAISTAGVLLAATSDNSHNGFIYRSTDGGLSWGLFPVYIGAKVGPHNMVYKVRFDPENPNTAIFMDAYANVTHSTDGGMTWQVAGKSTTCK
jgi:hypothetical protein